jgi:polyribonucleotide nucleotidyltransferase
VSRMVAGVAMGLILEPDGSFVVLTDILGSEDALGDMDFKVAGDDNGVTAFQMDIKVEGITIEIMAQALSQAKEGRKHILAEMKKCHPPPRKELSQYSPRISFMTIPVDKIGTVIGAGGRTARSIQDETGVELNFDQDGELQLKGPNDASLQLASEMVLNLITDPEPGRVYRNAKVVQVTNFGAFVEIAPKKDGLLHVSEWDFKRTASISDVVKEGDIVDVMVLEVSGSNGKIKLSRKAVLELDGVKPPENEASEEEEGDPLNLLDKDDLKPGAILKQARVKQVQGYGAFVQVARGRDALLHVSEWDTKRTEVMNDVVSEGDLVDVMILEVEEGRNGKIRASRKALFEQDE